MTRLEKFKQKNGAALKSFTQGLYPFAAGVIVATVIGAGVPGGTLSTGFVKELQESAVDAEASAPAQTADNHLRTGPLKLDLGPVAPRQVFEMDLENMLELAAIDARADDELGELNAIRHAVTDGEAFQSGIVDGDAKADAIDAALSFALVAKDMDTVQYDNHLFTVSKSLPQTSEFKEVVDLLNWKRSTIDKAQALTHNLSRAVRDDDADLAGILLSDLNELFENYEFVTDLNKTRDEILSRLKNGANEDSTATDELPATESLRSASLKAAGAIREHLSSAQRRPAITMSLSAI